MLSNRFKELRKELKLTQGELAARLGVTQQAIAKWECGRAVPEVETLSRIAAFFGVTTDFLLGRANTFTAPDSVPRVAIIGAVRAGYNAFAFEEHLGSAPAEVKNPDSYRYLVVKGDSMEPFIREGDLALVRLQPELQNGDLGVVLYGDGEATLKKYHRCDDTVSLIPFNQSYETITLRGAELEELRIFGKVVQTSTKW